MQYSQSEFSEVLWESEEERMASAILSHLQAAHIHTLRLDAIRARLALRIDHRNPTEFLQDDAVLLGQIKAYEALLETSNLNLQLLKDNQQ